MYSNGYGKYDNPGQGNKYGIYKNGSGNIEVPLTIEAVIYQYLGQTTIVNKEYSDKGAPYAEYHIANNQVISQKMFGLHGLVTPGKEDTLNTNGGLMYYQYDGAGSVTELTNRQGEEIEHYRYDAFGNIFTGITSPYNTTAYTGQDYDDLTGLVQMDARWYAPNLGRFTSQDLYAGDTYNPQSLNRYSYVMNNPINMWDPTGHVPEWVVKQENYFEASDDATTGDAYYFQSFNSSSSGWQYTGEVKTNDIVKYLFQSTVTNTWIYKHTHLFDGMLVKDPYTFKEYYHFEGFYNTTDTFTQTDYYYNEVIKKAEELADENQDKINDLLGDPPKNSDPTNYDPKDYNTYAVSISTKKVGNGTEELWESDPEQIIVEHTGERTVDSLRPVTGAVQIALNAIMDNSHLSIDGGYGDKTKEQVRKHQQGLNLTANGTLDLQTFYQIQITLAKERQSSPDSSSTGGSTQTNQGTGKTVTSNDAKSPCKNISEFKERYGDLLEEYAEEFGIDVNVLGAIVFTESGGGGFYSNGKLKIRFENHVFIRGLGDRASFHGVGYEYKKYFDFTDIKGQRSEGHRYRTSEDSDWIKMHVNQSVTEYGAFQFAKTINEDAAYMSISMGFGQTMGFNYKACGFSSAKAMFDAYSNSEKTQIIGMMNFIKNNNLIKYIKDKDYANFGIGYNGSALYGVEENIEKYKNTK